MNPLVLPWNRSEPLWYYYTKYFNHNNSGKVIRTLSVHIDSMLASRSSTNSETDQDHFRKRKENSSPQTTKLVRRSESDDSNCSSSNLVQSSRRFLYLYCCIRSSCATNNALSSRMTFLLIQCCLVAIPLRFSHFDLDFGIHWPLNPVPQMRPAAGVSKYDLCTNVRSRFWEAVWSVAVGASESQPEKLLFQSRVYIKITFGTLRIMKWRLSWKILLIILSSFYCLYFWATFGSSICQDIS
jgi:hypothetical protein